jgi:sialate O-acetylesterase
MTLLVNNLIRNVLVFNNQHCKMMLFNILVASICLLLTISEAQERPFTVSPLYSDNVVLQKSPQRSHFYGTGSPGKNVTIRMISPDDVEFFNDITEVMDNGYWSLKLPSQPATLDGGGYTIHCHISGSGLDIEIKNVVFGDIWVCSGQSNMELHMENIFNAEDEIQRLIDETPNMRYMRMNLVTSEVPIDDLRPVDISQFWTLPEADSLRLRDFFSNCSDRN